MDWVEQLEQEFEPARDYFLRVGRDIDNRCVISLIYPCEEYEGVGQTYSEALENLLKKIRTVVKKSKEWEGKREK